MFKYIFKKVATFLILVIYLCCGKIATGESFDVKVSKKQTSNNYQTINSAIKNGAKRIFIDAGIYNEQIELPDGVQLFGKDFSKTFLTGGIIMHDNTAISGVTISKRGIITASDSDVFIDNVKITDAVDNGIEIVGFSKLALKNSEIYQSAKKGIYIRWGGIIEITNSKVSHNQEEGIDLRGFVRGYIRQTEIDSNGESGLEAVVGDSKLILAENKFINNKSSGVDLQYYSISPNTGQFYFFNNTLKDNREYGLNCDRPSGGSDNDKYWEQSIFVSHENNFVNNQKSDIHKRCSVQNDYKAHPFPTYETVIKEYELDKWNKDEKVKKRDETENDVNLRLNKMRITFQKLKTETEKSKQALQKMNRVIIFVFGIKYATLQELRKVRDEYSSVIEELLDLTQKTTDQNKINELNTLYQEALTLQANETSLINYYKNLGLFNKFKCLLNFKSSDSKCYEK